VLYFHQKSGIVHIYSKGNGKFFPELKELRHKAYQLRPTSDKFTNVYSQ